MSGSRTSLSEIRTRMQRGASSGVCPGSTNGPRFVKSTAALRVARRVAELHLPFPRLSHDDLEQFLIEEAVMERYFAERQEAEKSEQARTDARKEAEETLQAYRREKGLA